MADGSSGNQGQIIQWQCKYCPKTFLGVPPGSFDFCPKCGKEQKEDPLIPEITCNNPECKATLFSEKAEICHICKKPQKQNPAAVMPTDSSKREEHKLKIAQAVAVESKKRQSQESEAASHGAGKLMTAGNQSAAEPHEGGAQSPPDAPTLKQRATPKNPIVIDSTNATIPDKATSAETTVTGPNSNINKSDAEGTAKHANEEGSRFQDKMSANDKALHHIHLIQLQPKRKGHRSSHLVIQSRIQIQVYPHQIPVNQFLILIHQGLQAQVYPIKIWPE